MSVEQYHDVNICVHVTGKTESQVIPLYRCENVFALSKNGFNS